MAGRTLLDSGSPITQSIDAIKGLLAFVGRASNPLPAFVEMGKEESRVVLVLSNKKDCYYVVMAQRCSCPSASYRPSQSCKHQRKFFGGTLARVSETAKELESVKPKLPAFRPFDTMPGEEKAAKASIQGV